MKINENSTPGGRGAEKVHLAVVDMQRQLGFPSLWYTLAPYEWSMPYHEWILHEMQAMLRSRLHLPGPETLHLAHSLTELVTGLLTGANEKNAQKKARNWSQHLLRSASGEKLVINFVARLEFQDGKRKQGTQAYHGRGAVHIHVLTWDDEDKVKSSDLHAVLSGTVPVENPLMSAYVLGSQPSNGDSAWPVREEPSALDPDSGQVLLQHSEVDKANGLRAYFPDVTAATKGSHQDAQRTDGRGLLLKYIATYLPKFSDSFAQEWLNEGGSDINVARKVLFDYHPLEPEMWLQLASKQHSCFIAGGTFYPIVAPYPGMDTKPKFVELYEGSKWRGKGMTLLEFLRKSNKDGEIIRHIKEAWKRSKQGVGVSADEENNLEAFARDYDSKGEKLVAADTVWRLNDRYFGQWLALNQAFDNLENFHVPEIREKVPGRLYYLSLALHWRPDFWRDPTKIREEMALEAAHDSHIKTVLSMVAAKTHMIDEYLAGRVPKDTTINEDTAPTLGARPGKRRAVQQDPMQEKAINLTNKHVDASLAIQDARGEELEQLLQHAQLSQIVAVLGPPGTGKTRVAKHCMLRARRKGGEVLFTYPTGVMQARMRQEMKDSGVVLDTCHGGYLLHKSEQESLPLLEGVNLAGVDEFPQLCEEDWERIARVWLANGKSAAMLQTGDFYQLPSISGTNARSSRYWKHVKKVYLKKSFRSDDDSFLAKLDGMRVFLPQRQLRNSILRGHKAWNHPGAPTNMDLKILFRKHPKTTILTCTRAAAREVGETAAEALLGRRKVLAVVPGDYDGNAANFDKQGKLKEGVKPEPAPVHLRRGLRLHLTRNLDKEGDFVNGMEAEVVDFDARSQCLSVRTKTGKPIPVYLYTDPDPKAQKATFFPIRLGYACTVYKMQGSELDHVTIYLDRPGAKAHAYVAMSRVRTDGDYLFGGKYTKEYFLPSDG